MWKEMGSVPDFGRRSYPGTEQTHGPPEKNEDGGRIDEEGAELWQPVLARGVGDAEKQRGDERSTQAAQSSDRHHDEEEHQMLERIARLHRDDVGAEPPAQAGEAAAEREGQHEEAARVDANGLRHRAVVDRGA